MWKLFGILGMLFCLEGVAGGKGKGAQDIPSSGVRRNVREVDLMGHFSIRNETYKNTRFGGISGLVFNPNRGVYYALSNDPKEPRFYTIEMKVNKKFRRRDIDIEAVTFLKTAKGDRFPPGDLDPEGIAYRNGRIFISSEGNVDKRIDPAIIEFNHPGTNNSDSPFLNTTIREEIKALVIIPPLRRLPSLLMESGCGQD